MPFKNNILIIIYVYFLLQSYRLARGQECIKDQTDIAAQYIKQLQDSIERAKCELVDDITYTDYNPEEGEEFDFIVVGGGTAGSVVAGRLTENSFWRVLVLEAGGNPSLTTEVPQLKTDINRDLFWPYKSEPEPNCCQGNKNKKCDFRKGKVLGGCSTVNGMAYVRGHPVDFDAWEQMGNPGWSYKDLLPYFKKSEDIRSIDFSNPEFFKYHSVGGLLQVELFNTSFTHYRSILRSGFESLGYQSFNDVNAQFHEGVFPFHGTLKNARRLSAAKAFLHKFQKRSNLKISSNSLVNKVLIDKNNRSAFGVLFTKNGRNMMVRSSKEIILSAGVISSPQILILSGVGPEEHLRNLQINLIKDLPVGHNLHDHVRFLGYIVTANIGIPNDNINDAMFDFLVNSKLVMPADTISLTGEFKTGKATYPNIQFIGGYIYPSSVKNTTQNEFLSELNDDIVESIRRITSIKPALWLTFIIGRPKSRGKLLLRSSNILDHPLIYPRLLTEEDDVRQILEGIEFLDKLVMTPPLKQVEAKLRRIDISECNKFRFRSEAYWRCIIKYMSFPYVHTAGTCKMGPRERRDSVVDPQLRVMGVKNLRVVDASIMPVVTSKNTMAPVIAIAEKAADMIKQSGDGFRSMPNIAMATNYKTSDENKVFGMKFVI